VTGAFRLPKLQFYGLMVPLRLRSAVIAGTLLVLLGCGRERPAERQRFVPAPKDIAAPPARERPESAEPPKRDPSAKPPVGYRRMAVGGVAPTKAGSAIVLMDDSARRGLLLVIGRKEAVPVAVPFERAGVERPLTHDLLYAAVKKLGGDVVSVRVDRLEDDVFYGSVLLLRGGQFFELDARPADALSLAVGNGVPVFVAEAVLTRAGIDVDKFDFRRFGKAAETPHVGRRRDEVEL
jgi:bifunctional DNase/RNase